MLPPRHQKQAKKLLWNYWPRRLFSERLRVVVLLLLSLVGLVTYGLAPDSAKSMRMAVFDAGESLLSALATPAESITHMVEHVTGLSDMSSDLAHLREENARLRQWYDRARQLEAENRSLRGLVRLADLPHARFVTARVIAVGGTNFANGIVVDAGSLQGVTTDMVAMTGGGVIGRVVALRKGTAHIVLLNDANARVPVIIENSRHRGVLAGDNSDQPQLLYLPEDAAVTVGERVMTSGLGGIFTAGLPIGTIVKTAAGDIRVRPFADLRRLEIIQLIDFGHTDALNPDTESTDE